MGHGQSQPLENNSPVERPEETILAKATDKLQDTAGSGVGDLTEKVKQERAEKKRLGKSGATGYGRDEQGRGGLVSAKELLGDAAHGCSADGVNNHGESSAERQQQIIQQAQSEGYIPGQIAGPEPEQIVGLIAADDYRADHGLEVKSDGGGRRGADLGWGSSEGNVSAQQRGADGRWHFENPRGPGGRDVAGRLKEWIRNDGPQSSDEAMSGGAEAAGNVLKGTVDGVWNITVGAAEIVNRHLNAGRIPEGAGMDFISGGTERPLEIYNQFYKSNLDLNACDQAYQRYELDKRGIDRNLIPGLIWNEILHRKPEDANQDAKAAAGEDQSGLTSIGPAQMQIRHLRELAEGDNHLRLLGDPVKAALDPAKAPFFVAAYLSREARRIDAHNHAHPGDEPIPVTTETLAYRYNGDVFRDDSGDLRSLQPWEKLYRKAAGNLPEHLESCEWPTPLVVEHSHHVSKVRDAMRDVRLHR